jgi:hypothetical protein
MKKTTTPKPRKSSAKKKAGARASVRATAAPSAVPNDWRSDMLARIRSIIQAADPDAIEELKWRGVPVWSHDGIICTGETYKSAVKMTFAKGASLPDPAGLFNSSLEGNTRRAIDFHEGDKINEKALKTLIRAAVELNTSTRKKKR